MADFQYHGSDSLQTDAFKHLEYGRYWEAIEDFQELITRIKFKLKQVKGEQFVEALGILGKLRRGFAEALWHINRPQLALQIIQLCISENCHEFSEESASHWARLADRDRIIGEPQTILIGYEIAVHLTPPHDAVIMSRLLSKMLSFCCEFGQSFQRKITTILTDACKMEDCQSEEVVKIWMDCGTKLMSYKAFTKLSITCFTLALKFLPSTNSSLKAKVSHSRATAILTVNDSTQLDQAIRDAKTSVEHCPSVKGYTLLWKCCLHSSYYDDALASFTKALEFLNDQEEDKYKEFVKFFTTVISLKAFMVFKSGCPVPKCFVQRLINESVAKQAVKDLSLLFCEEGWAAECDASCVPLDMVLKSDFKNREELVRILLQHNALPRGLTTSSESPLSLCLQTDNSDMAVILLQKGADMNDLMREGESALRAAIRIGSKKGNFAILKYFLDSKKFSVDSTDEDGNTLLHILCRGKIDSKKQEAINILLETGANPLITNKLKKKPIDLVSNLRDNRKNLLSSAEESFKTPPSSVQNTAKEEGSTKIDEEVQEEKSQLPDLSATPSPSSSSSETTSPSIPSSKSNNTTKEPLSVVRERIHLFIKKLDVRAWFKKMASDTKARKGSTKTEKPELENDQKQTSGLEEASQITQEENGASSFNNEDNDSIVPVTSETCMEGAFEGLPWEVECTAEVWKVLHGKRLEPWKKKLFVEKVKTLAQGRDNWTLHLCKRLEGLPKSRGMLLYETRLTDAARIIWECAVAFSPRYSDEDNDCKTTIYSEIIRIWDIVFDHDNIQRATENIVTSFTRGRDCILKKELRGLPRGDASQNQGPNLYVKWAEADSAPEVKEDKADDANDEQVTFFPPASHLDNEYQVLKFYHLSTAMIQTILKQQSCHVEIDFPFRVTEEEHDIINFEPTPHSSIILIGRSGTGKTTCILYRLWKDFINYWKNALDTGPWIPKRVVFLPKDSSDSDSSNLEEGVLTGAISQQSVELQRTSDGGVTHADDCEEATSSSKEPFGSFQAVPKSEEPLEHLHQLFVTKNGVLCQEIKKNFNALSQACPFVKHATEEDVTPLKLQEVEDSATGWPLFLNARDLYVILDASLPKPYFFPRNEDGSLETTAQDWGEEDNQVSTIPVIDEDEDAEDEDAEDDTDDEDKDRQVDASSSEQKRSMVLVSYTVFENRLWSKMCKRKKHVNFHPSLIWMEIRSFIKGSYEALHTKSGHLSLEDYKKIGQKRAANFTAECREAIYKLFKSYERVKRSLNMFDENDLVFHLYHRLRHCRVPDWSIHNLYVDETQDFTQAELMLLICCCRDPNGVFLTGDTAQSVMRGISFRFEDLRSLFYYLNKNYKAVGAQSEVTVPKVMPLIYNYRSHSGILNLASSVVRILQKYFPESFDELAKDQGQLDGPKPVLLGSCSQSDLAIILRGNKRKTTTIEFGAHQAILVASNDARERLPEELSHALVLTIYEAKGLEFDDVLVYNFFKDSQASTEWRIVTQYLLEEVNQDSVNTAEVKSRPLPFNRDKHKILNSELKQLYTAVTRARAKVWFFDEDEEKRRPVFEYFEQLGLAEVVTLEASTRSSSHCSQSLGNMFSKESSVDEWEKQGTFFYSKKLWKVAEKCFTISGNVEMSQKSKAYVQADYARSLHSEPRRLKTEFLRAADQFLQCNMIQETRVCLYNARERSLYASLLQRLGEDKTAARWFERGGNFLEASECLEKLGDYKEAVEVLVRGNLYHKAIDVVKRFNHLLPVNQRKTFAPGRTLHELYLASAQLHFKGGHVEEMKNSLRFVHSVDVRVEFLKKRNLVDEAARELLNEGRGVEAAKIMRERGSFLVAAEYAKSSSNSGLAADCIFAYVRSSTEMPKEKQMTHLEEARNLYKEAKKINDSGEVLLQQAKLTGDHKKIEEAANIFILRSVQNTCGELECVELLCDSADGEYSVSGTIISRALKMVKAVLQLIKSMNASNLDVMTQKEIERCEEHFGLYREGDPSKRVVRRKEGDRFLAFAQEMQKRPVPGNKWEMDLYDVRERIAEALFHRLVKLIQQIRGFLDKTFAKHETCQRFLVGLPCSSEDCQYKHNLPSPDSTDKCFRAILDEISLDAQANDFHRVEKKYAHHNTRLFQMQLDGLEDLFPSDPFASCEKLLAFFFPANGQSSNIRLQSCISLLRDDKCRAHKQRLFKYAEELWKKRSTKEEILSSADLFLAVSHILRIIGSPQTKILSWIKDAEDAFRRGCNFKDNKPIIPKSVGIALEGDTRITLFSRWWENSKLRLHVSGDIFEAGHNAVRRFLSMAANPVKALPYPSPRNCLDILEYFTCAFLALFARLQQSQKSRYLVCLPASYESVISFWDSLNCTTSRHVGIYRAALTHQSRSSPIRQVKKFLHDVALLMLGGYSQNFNVLKKVLHFNSCIESGETERALILVLTMLCNCSQSIPSDSEVRLLQNLYTDPPDDVTLPEKIDRCLKQVRQAKGIRDIVIILQDLLRERKEILCDVHWDNFHQRLWWDKVNPDNYIGTFCTDVLEKLAQTTEELPAEKVPKTEDVEDSLTAEFGAQAEEEQATEDLDHTRSERFEAIAREEALQAESWEEEEEEEEEVTADEIPAEQEVIEDPIYAYFSAFRVDRSGCGICNVSFFADESQIWQYPLEHNRGAFEMNDPVANDFVTHISDLSYRPTFRTSHLSQDSPHWKKVEQFEAYQKLYREELYPHLIGQGNLFYEADHLVRTAEQRGKTLSILITKLDEVIRANRFVTEVTTRIQQQCNWADLESLKKATFSLREALKTCEEEIQLANSREAADPKSSFSSYAQALSWDLKEDPDVNDGQYAHVPGLRRKK